MVNTFAIGSIILGAGIFGGLVNYLTIFTKKELGSKRRLLGTILAGIAASCLVPLFLSMISSDLIVNSRKDDKYYFVFGGLCLIAGIFSRRFINSIGERILRQVEKSNEKMNEVVNENKDLELFIEMANELIRKNFLSLTNQPKGGKDDNRKIQ